MKTLINKITNTVSSVALFTLGIAMAGLGFAFLGMLALFAMVGMGVALLATPFLKMAHPPVTQTQTTRVSA